MKLRTFMEGCLPNDGGLPIQAQVAEYIDQMTESDFLDLFMEMGVALQCQERIEKDREYNEHVCSVFDERIKAFEALRPGFDHRIDDDMDS